MKNYAHRLSKNKTPKKNTTSSGKPSSKSKSPTTVPPDKNTHKLPSKPRKKPIQKKQILKEFTQPAKSVAELPQSTKENEKESQTSPLMLRTSREQFFPLQIQPLTKPTQPTSLASSIFGVIFGALKNIFMTDYMKEFLFSIRWMSIVIERTRWKGNQEAHRKHLKNITDELLDFGIGSDQFSRIAADRLVEVSFPNTQGSPRPFRFAPWEFLLSLPTKEFRRHKGLTVFRHMQLNRKSGEFCITAKVLLVQGARTQPLENARLHAEVRAIERGLGLTKENLEVLPAPTEKELLDCLKKFQPNIIHLNGIAWLPKDAQSLEPSNKDIPKPSASSSPGGFGLLSEMGQLIVYEPELFSDLLTKKIGFSVDLVSLNVQNSAPSLCSLLVEKGVKAAIGIQDSIEEVVIESFFSYFYRLLKISDFQIHKSFHLSWEKVQEESESLVGSGVVIWSEKSLTDLTQEELNKLRRNSKLYKHPLLAEIEKENREPVELEGNIHEYVSYEIKVPQDLNYALLHNGENLFHTFLLRLNEPGIIRDIKIKVVLLVGAEQFPYEALFNLDRRVLDLNQQIRIPLAWEFVRTVKESVKTTIHINISAGAYTLYNETHSVNLLPVDTWRDGVNEGESFGVWLPSFVQPRDPAISQTIKRGECYLRALVDDNQAAFDGYQSIAPYGEDPSEGIDFQVRSIWAALVNEKEISYINPPPSYSFNSQRLRSPSDVLEGQSGTCIDLCLLVAACLEYVDIYPVIFLFKGHAFVGYWRSERSHNDFVSLGELFQNSADSSELNDEQISKIQDQLILSRPINQQRPWVVGQEAYSEIVNFVIREDMIPIETVAMTEKKGFGEAVEKGSENLSNQSEFEALLDIRLARVHGVTPLPLKGAST